MEIFKLFGSIFVDTDAAEKSMQKIEQTAEKLGNGIVKMGDKFSSIGTKLSLGVTTPIVALGTKAVKTAADFEAAMSEVSAISGATGDDLEKLEQLAKQMGETTKFSATESAEALKYMAMAGWKTEDMLNGLEGIMNLAAASGEDLGTTSDIVTDALTAFGLSAKDSGHFADILATASSNANTNVSMMGETFKYVAPVAGALGYSAQDVALATGLMANSGIKASQAGTSLRTTLTKLANPTKDMKGIMVELGLATEETANIIDEGKLLKAQVKVENKTADMEKAQIKYNDAVAKYGVNSSQAQTAALNLEKAQNSLQSAVYDLDVVLQGETETTGINNKLLVDSEGNMRTLREVILILRDAFKGLSEEEQAQAASALFGQEAMSGMLAIINASEEDFEKLATAIDDADGSAKEMADTMNDNLSGQITLLKSQVESLFIQFATLVMPYLREGIQWLSEVIEYISSLDDGTKRMIVKIGLLAAALGPLMTILGKGISIIGNVIKIGSKLASGIGGIIKIGGSLASGATKLVGLFSGAVTFVTGTLIPAISAIGAPVLIVIGVIGGLVAAGVALYKNWDAVKEWAGNVWGAIKDIVGGAVEKIKGFFTGIIDFVKDNWQGLLLLLVNPFAGAFKLLYDNCEQFRNFINGFLEKIKEGFRDFVEKIKGFFTGIIDFVKDNWQGLLLLLVNPFAGAFKLLYDNCEQFRNFINGFLEKIKQGIKNFADAVLNTLSKAWESIKAVTETVFSAVRDFLSAIWDGIKAVVTAAVDTVKKVISMAWETVKKVTETVFNAISKIVSAIWHGIKKVIETVTGAIKSVVTTAWNAIADTVGRVVGGIRDAISNGLNAAKDIVSNVLNAIKDKFQSIFDGAKNIVSGAIEKIKSFFRFEWSLPKIKLPHFKISGGFSLNPPSIPSFGVEWYKKGGVMMEPTKFAVNPSTGKDMVGGEAGPEAIAPIEILKEYIREAVSDRDDRVYAVLEAILELLQELLPKIPQMRVVLDSGALVGELADPMNEKLGEIIYKRRRQN